MYVCVYIYMLALSLQHSMFSNLCNFQGKQYEFTLTGSHLWRWAGLRWHRRIQATMNPIEWASTKGPEIHLGLEAWERGKRFPQKENIIDLVLIPGWIILELVCHSFALDGWIQETKQQCLTVSVLWLKWVKRVNYICLFLGEVPGNLRNQTVGDWDLIRCLFVRRVCVRTQLMQLKNTLNIWKLVYSIR